MTGKIKHISLGLLALLLSNTLLAQSSPKMLHHTKENKVFVWAGKLFLLNKKEKQEVPALLQYQAYDSIPGRYHKQLIVGELKSRNSDECHFLLGYVENQRDVSYHFYGFAEDGQIEQTILTGGNDKKMAGYLADPTKAEMGGAFKLFRKDTLIAPKSIEATPDKIFGTYVYDFGPGQPEGRLKIQKNKNGTVNLELYSIDKGGSGYVKIHKDSLHLKGTSFIVDAKAYGVSVYKVLVKFYKGFAVTAFVEPNTESDRFGKRATVEGFFIKQKEAKYGACWKGTLGKNIPVFLHYQKQGSLVVGAITYLNTKAKQPIPLIGTTYVDGRLGLNEYATDGNITGIWVVAHHGDSLTGHWYAPYSEEQYPVTLTNQYTPVPASPITADLQNIAGEYNYQYGKKGPQGGWTIKRINKDSISISGWSVTHAPARNIANVNTDTVALVGNHFIYQVSTGDKCKIVMKGTFYKHFLRITYINDAPCHYYFGHNATLEGIFYKTKESSKANKP